MRQLGRHSRRVTMVRASLPLLLLVARLDTGEPTHTPCCLDTSPCQGARSTCSTRG